MSITAKELSQKLNLSEAAVSMALNHKPGVSTATRQAVLEAAEKYGYDFTRISGRRSKNGAIYFCIYKKDGAIVADTPFFSQLSEGIEAKCKEEGYHLNICYLYGDDTIAMQIEKIRCSDCIGIVLLGTEMRPHDFAPFSGLPIPLVLLDVYFEGIARDYVLINNVQGAALATDFLIAKTRSQPGYLRSSYPISNFDERADGFYQSVRRHGMSPSRSIVHRLTPSVEGALADMADVLSQGEEIARCYFSDNDFIAVGAMKALQKAGRRIPEDVAVVGFDNVPIGRFLEPSLTTVNVPKEYMGEMAALRLMDLIRGNRFVPVKLEVSTSLVERRSL